MQTFVDTFFFFFLKNKISQKEGIAVLYPCTKSTLHLLQNQNESMNFTNCALSYDYTGIEFQ